MKNSRFVRFDSIWISLSKEGKCDGIGGMEYLRVKREWISEGYPSDIPTFIHLSANRLPSHGNRN